MLFTNRLWTTTNRTRKRTFSNTKSSDIKTVRIFISSNILFGKSFFFRDDVNTEQQSVERSNHSRRYRYSRTSSSSSNYSFDLSFWCEFSFQSHQWRQTTNGRSSTTSTEIETFNDSSESFSWENILCNIWIVLVFKRK